MQTDKQEAEKTLCKAKHYTEFQANNKTVESNSYYKNKLNCSLVCSVSRSVIFFGLQIQSATVFPLTPTQNIHAGCQLEFLKGFKMQPLTDEVK